MTDRKGGVVVVAGFIVAWVFLLTLGMLVFGCSTAVAQNRDESVHGFVSYSYTRVLPEEFDAYSAGSGVAGTIYVPVSKGMALTGSIEYYCASNNSLPKQFGRVEFDGLSFYQTAVRVGFSPTLWSNEDAIIFLTVNGGYAYSGLTDFTVNGSTIWEIGGSGGGLFGISLNANAGPLLVGVGIDQNVNTDIDNPAAFKVTIGFGL